MREWLRKKRKSSGMTQAQVADASNITRSYYSMIESGTRTPNVNVAKDIGRALKFEWGIFFYSSSDYQPRKKERG